LQFWDDELQKSIRKKSIPSEMRLVDGKASLKKKVTETICQSWSDHRPVVADIELSNELLIKQAGGIRPRKERKSKPKKKADAIDQLKDELELSMHA